MPSHQKEFRLGDLLLERHLVTQSQLDDAIRYQKKHQDIQLGEILIKDNLISQKQLTKCLKRQNALRSALFSVAMCLLPTQMVFAENFDTDSNTNWQQEAHHSKYIDFNDQTALHFQEVNDAVYSFSGPVTIFSKRMAHNDRMIKHAAKPEPTQYKFDISQDGFNVKVKYEF